ncbi:MAG: catalase [Bosea sp. (in: a-proteobacteria)]
MTTRPTLGLLLAPIAFFASSTPPQAQTATPEAFVTTMRNLAGNQKARPSGAKGQCWQGTFTPAAEARALSKSPLFAKPSPVLARFSVGGGNPKAMDGGRGTNRGFSFRIDGSGPGASEFVMINAPINFAKSPEQMLGYFEARLPGADGKPDAAKIKAFSDANPETTAQGRYLAGKPIAGSWVATSYWAVHNYKLTNAAGASRLIKLRMVPLAGEIGLTDDEAKAKPADFLVDDLSGRLAAKTPTGFTMVAYMGKPGDEKTNATQLWDDEDKREQVKLGTVTITAIEKNETCDVSYFDPSKLADGLSGPTDDPLFNARKPAYAISTSKRQ